MRASNLVIGASIGIFGLQSVYWAATNMSKYLEGKIRLVNELIDSNVRVGYEDLVLILCTVLSACASGRWPGPRIDRKRFVELLIEHSPPDLHTSWISVPALVNKNLVRESDTPYARDNTRIFRDEEIDLCLPDAVKVYPRIDPRNLKRCSYAALIYDWLRCSYAHEYRADEHITQVAASRHSARVSYIGRRHGNGIRRMASFHLGYLISLAQHHATNELIHPRSRPSLVGRNRVDMSGTRLCVGSRWGLFSDFAPITALAPRRSFATFLPDIGEGTPKGPMEWQSIRSKQSTG